MSIEEQTILQGLINSQEFLRKTIPYIQSEYFVSNTYRIIFQQLKDYIEKYNTVPIRKALVIDLASATEKFPMLKNDQFVQEILESIKTLYSVDAKETIDKAHADWLIDITEKWCKDRAIYNAILESVAILDNKDKEKRSQHAIPEILETALAVSFDQTIGHDYVEDSDERYEYYHKKEERIEFDIEIFNKITRGGVPKKTLNLLLAGTGVGKSLIKCHLAASYLMQSMNVLFITMEMSEEKIAERIDANLMDTSINDIHQLPYESFTNKVQSIKSKTHGRLFIKEFPTGSASVAHFRILINELKQKKSFIPDVIFIDYLNICASSRFKSLTGSNGTYSYVKSIAEEIRGLAIEMNVPIWSSTQANRSGLNNTDMDITNISESLGVAATVDLMLGAIVTDELLERNQIFFKQLKNRYNSPDYYGKFYVGVDRSRMKLYDLEEHAQPQQPTNNITPQESPADFSAFKV